MKKTLYLMRHGQTLFNLQKKIQGWCDSPLTQLGIKQAEIARDYFTNNNITFDEAYSSTSQRASDTLEIVTNFSMDYKREKDLREWNFGKLEGHSESLNPPLPYNDFFKQFDGETQDEFIKRTVNSVTKIMENTAKNTILIVSHGAFCANFLRSFEEYNIVHYKKGIKNCTVFKFEYENNIFSCVEIIEHDFSSIE